MSPKI